MFDPKETCPACEIIPKTLPILGVFLYTKDMNKNKNCNRNLPTNALNVTNVEPGMRIRFAFDTTGTHTVLSVSKGYGQRVTIVTDKGRKEATKAGTVRLVGVEGYNYHEGHGCPKG